MCRGGYRISKTKGGGGIRAHARDVVSLFMKFGGPPKGGRGLLTPPPPPVSALDVHVYMLLILLLDYIVPVDVPLV